MRQFQEQFGILPETRVLDIGGTPFNWSLLSVKPNLLYSNIQHIGGEPVNQIIADGRFQPFKDNAFDVVYSNSVIEHLGTVDHQLWFPVEPHYITPFIHWLPIWLCKRLMRNFTL